MFECSSLPVHFTEHDVDAAEDCDDVGDKMAARYFIDDAEIHETRPAHLYAERIRRPVTDDVVPKLAARILEAPFGGRMRFGSAAVTSPSGKLSRA
jgi:hypothetical protein